MKFEDLNEIKKKNISFQKKLKNQKNNFILSIKDDCKTKLENITEYIACDGYFALAKALLTMNRQQVVDEIIKSDLRGRGGAGFPTGKKWELCKNQESEKKYVICNCDEGDPGAFMDRTIAEDYPHAILEAMAIAGYAIGADEGIIYVRAEYPRAVERLNQAIVDASKLGLIGNNIFETKFCFNVSLKLGAGAFVCGEETALIKSCEGQRGEPKLKPPYPAERGYKDKPTLINNIETLANIPKIILNGSDWFCSLGEENSKGTKVFALSGKVKNAGLYELPIGATIKQLVYECGGGVLNDKQLKAVQMGGPSGGCIPTKFCDTKIDYESLKQLGAMMGSGGVIVMDEDTCMVDISKFFLEFSVDESCGKCTPCRIGNKRLHEILQKICEGLGTLSDLNELENLANYIKDNSLCGLGQASPNPVLSTLKYFKEEYLEHILEKRCRAGVCKKLTKYNIMHDKCVACSLCFKFCPVDAIYLDDDGKYTIDQNKCIRCGKCKASCRFGAIERK